LRLTASGGVTLVPLTRRSDFVRATRQAHSTATPGFILQMLPLGPPQPGRLRVGFTASRKFSKHAVDRNRAKRRLRALAQMDLAACGTEDHAYIFIARRAVLDRSFEDLRRDLRKAVQRLEREAQPSNPEQT
jgi:ribonuclease P protein component